MKRFPAKFLSILALLSVICSAAFASQNSVVLSTTSPYPGLTMLNDANAAFNTLQTNFSGASAPGTPATWQFWLDTSNNILNIYNGAVWLPIGKVASSQFVPLSNSVPFVAPSSTGSSNAYIVTYAPVPGSLVAGQHYPFVANFANTSAATLKVNAQTAHAITKQGAVALISGDIPNGAVVDTVWDGTQFQMISQSGTAATGTVTSVSCGSGLSGGTFTTSGGCAVNTAVANSIMANTGATPAVPIGTTAIPPNVTAATQASNDSTTKVATTAFANPDNSQAANGYDTLPSGLIIEWGSTNALSSGASQTITLPKTFPTSFFVVTASSMTLDSSGTASSVPSAVKVSNSQFTVTNNSAATLTYGWMAIGD